MSEIIDAHQHCWQLSRPECSWPTPELSSINRDFSPEDWLAVAQPHRVAGSVLVQSQPNDADTDFLLELATQNDFILGVVGWADLKAASAPARLKQLAQHPKMRGIRPMLQALPEDSWIDDPLLKPAIDAMLAHQLSFDALVYTRHLPYVLRFAIRYPTLKIILDHAAKPPIASGERSGWRQQMARLAALPNVYCKVSGLVTEASPEQGLADLQTWFDELLELFGSNRLLWGSDWPVVNLAGSYASWLNLTENLLDSVDSADRHAILSATARRVYRLD